MQNNMKKIAVLISGQGSNLQAIIEACQTRFIPGKIVTVISNKIDSFGLKRAKSAGIPSRVFCAKILVPISLWIRL